MQNGKKASKFRKNEISAILEAKRHPTKWGPTTFPLKK
jgi:hypothetical protein